MSVTARITPRGEDRLRSGHPWIYRSDVREVDATPGAVVRVLGAKNRFLGHAFFSDQSQIVLRMVSRGETPVDAAFWRARLAAAIAFRATLGLNATAFRLVHGEADLLPSLIVDRYADILVLQALSQGMDRLVPALIPMLVELTGARGVIARNDPKVRLLEGLEQKVEVLYGEVPATVAVHEGPVAYDVDPWHGQKTGLFLDQRENRDAAAQYAHGRVLDCFSYNGGFALRLASVATEVEALDSSADAVARILQNAAKNGLGNVRAREANVFDELRRLERENARFDTIVLDPPAFAKNKASVDSHTPVAVVEKRMQGRDHPVLLGVPETYYLKCFILRKLA